MLDLFVAIARGGETSPQVLTLTWSRVIARSGEFFGGCLAFSF